MKETAAVVQSIFFFKNCYANSINNVKIKFANYKMNNCNTLGIGNALKASGLQYLPEAHCYLRYREK